jgi:hypothetical protein
VLPGIGIMAAIVLFGVGWWRRTQRPQAEALVERLRLHLEASFTVGSAAPFAPGPIA